MASTPDCSECSLPITESYIVVNSSTLHVKVSMTKYIYIWNKNVLIASYSASSVPVATKLYSHQPCIRI